MIGGEKWPSISGHCHSFWLYRDTKGWYFFFFFSKISFDRIFPTLKRDDGARILSNEEFSFLFWYGRRGCLNEYLTFDRRIRNISKFLLSTHTITTHVDR